MRGLFEDGGFEEPVAEDTKGENGCGKAIAGGLGVSASELC